MMFNTIRPPQLPQRPQLPQQPRLGSSGPSSLMDMIRNRLQGNRPSTDPRGLTGILSRGNPLRPGTNRGMASGNNPGLHLGQNRQGVDKRPVPALTSSNPHREAIMRRLSNRNRGPRMNSSYTEQ